MSITDELREWGKRLYTPNSASLKNELERIADRIDAEHQKAEDEWKAKDGQMWLKGYSECHAELMEGNETLASDLERCGWVRLPVDADGVPIHVGDRLTDSAEHKSEGISESLMLESTGWYVNFGSGWANERIHEWHHYTPPTVEDVLREMIDEMFVDVYADPDTIAEYAKRLRLAGEGE